jgi:hypothetical protein
MEVGLSDLESVGRLTETEALEFLERLRVYPGHRLRLLRAIDSLRHASLGAERRDASEMLEDDAALDRLCAQNEALSKEKGDAESEVKRLQEENKRLLGVVQQQDGHLQKHRDRIQELEELVQTQTEQVSFLAQQLSMVANGDPKKENELYRSYRDTYEDTHNDWAEAERIILPEATQMPDEAQADGTPETFGKGRAFTPEEFAEAAAAVETALPAMGAPSSVPAPGRGGIAKMGESRKGWGTTGFSPPRRSKLAQSLDSAQIRECLAGFDVDHIIQCLAAALQNKIIISTSRAKPHGAPQGRVAECAIFLEPACLERLQNMHAQQQVARIPSSGGNAPDGGGVSLLDSMGKPVDPLNAVAVRTVPNKWDIYGFLRDVMVNFRLEPEVSVVTLFYVERFTELSLVALTPDNWQRLTISSMMLASKVWNDESFENIEFAQLCPLYTIDEINTFERIFLKCIGYNCAVKGSEYAKTYFLLRTLGAKDKGDFGLEPLDGLRATRLAERCLEKQIEFRERYPDDAGMNAMNWTL